MQSAASIIMNEYGLTGRAVLLIEKQKNHDAPAEN